MLILSRKLTHPLKALTKTVREITRTGDYSKQVVVTSEDEIGILSESFNRLISQTGSLIEEIRRQERLHHDQLIKLIAFFNALIETKTQQETIDTALAHIKSFFVLEDIAYLWHRPDTPDATVLPLTYYNYKNRRETDAGYIVIAPEHGQLPGQDLLSPISKMIRLQLEHIHLLADTKEALEAKSTFLSTMSHELRTPLGSILNLTQHLTLMPGIDEEARRMLGAIETSAQHLLAMINNILQLSKLESNSIVVHKEPVDLTELMHEIFEITEPLITDKEIALIKDIACEGVTIQTDANLLKQVIINLLSNAIKFTEKGTIEVSLRRHGDHYRFSVRDTGIGIAKSRQKHLFQLFYQAHSETEKIPDSSGLGLALSQKVAALLGGKITIRSEGIGHGTTAIFTFTSF
jgi:signal transduction histidine kinase